MFIDATKVQANASLDSVVTSFAVEAHLAAVFEIDEGPVAANTNSIEASLVTTEAQASPAALPVALSTETHEGLAVTNAGRHDWYAEAGRQQRGVTAHRNPRIADLRVSTTDPDASPMRRASGPLHLGYQTHYVVDGGKARIILAVLVAPFEVMENQPMRDLLWHVRFRWHLRPQQMTGDTTYGP